MVRTLSIVPMKLPVFLLSSGRDYWYYSLGGKSGTVDLYGAYRFVVATLQETQDLFSDFDAKQRAAI